MKILKKSLLAVSILFICGIFNVSAEEPNSGKLQNTEQERKIDVLDFKETPICDVFKIFTDLTGKNIVAGKEIMKLKVTLFLKGVGPQEALKTMCKLYNLWFSEEDDVIRVMTAEDYGRELTIRRDEKTFIYKLKYASCLAVADLLDSLFGGRIEYVEPEEVESYGHVGTEEGVSKSSGRVRRGGRARTTRYDATYAAARGAKEALEIEKELTSKRIEELEKKAEEKELELKDVLEAKREQAVVYLAVFPRNNSIVCRSVDVTILKDIGDFIKNIDTPTSQVLLEGKILEITLTDDFDSFFDFDIKPESGEHITGIGNFASFDSATLIYQFIDKQIEARIELFEEKNQLKVIGTPMILCANNASGEFFIGEQRPITINYEHEIREFEERTTETVRPVIELRDIGTKLTIVPSINEDRTVTMRFLAEVDTLNPEGANISIVNQEGEIVTLPIDTVDTSRVQNIIVAEDTSTLAIGGLIRETDQHYEQKVPLLGDIPLLGFFFKKKAIKKEKTETVFLITPHIMMVPEENQAISDGTIRKLSDHPHIKDRQERLLDYDRKEKTLKGVENPQSAIYALEENLLEGKILTVDEKHNFAVIDLGRDAGLKIGDTFLVYRGDKFVGTVKVVKFRQNLSIVYAVEQTEIGQVKQQDKVMGLLQ